METRDDPTRRAIVSNPDLDPTRANPEPWFVGRGTGLMIGVLTLCALLIALRAASMIWMAESAWAWWENRLTMSAAAERERRPPRIVQSYNPVDWFVADEYPIEAVRREQQGRTVVRWTTSPQGRATHCTVVKSSGYRSLDAATCNVIMRNGRIRITPGKAAPPYQTTPVRWVLPDE